MKIVISIFSLPYEIDDLAYTIHQLKQSSLFLSNKHDWFLDVSVCTSSELINWDKSSIPENFFFEKLASLYNISDWCERNFLTSKSILGSLSQKIFSMEKHPDADFFVWLDTDIIFNESTLQHIEASLEANYQSYPYLIMTPEIVRIWDNTWDCIVNKQYLSKPLGYHKIHDPFLDCGVKGAISTVRVINTIPGKPRFKFASGWFGCLSHKLLKRIGIPKNFGPYGLEDTFIIFASEKLVKSNSANIVQLKIQNLVVCENYRHRDYSHYLDHLTVFSKKDIYKNISLKNFDKELQKVR